jgi:hypothetical protein
VRRSSRAWTRLTAGVPSAFPAPCARVTASCESTVDHGGGLNAEEASRGLAEGLGHVQGNGGANESLQGLLVNAVALAKIDGTSDITLEAGVEET